MYQSKKRMQAQTAGTFYYSRTSCELSLNEDVSSEGFGRLTVRLALCIANSLLTHIQRCMDMKKQISQEKAGQQSRNGKVWFFWAA